jgi:hypothetical protein
MKTAVVSVAPSVGLLRRKAASLRWHCGGFNSPLRSQRDSKSQFACQPEWGDSFTHIPSLAHAAKEALRIRRATAKLAHDLAAIHTRRDCR